MADGHSAEGVRVTEIALKPLHQILALFHVALNNFFVVRAALTHCKDVRVLA